MRQIQEQEIHVLREIEYTIDLTREYHNLLQREEGKSSQAYVWDGNAAFYEEGGSKNFYLQDELGSPLRFARADGSLGEAYGYDEFGRDLYGNQGEAQAFGYTGYQYDSITGTYYAQAREYEPGVGRFAGMDVIGGFVDVPTTLNRYGYCLQNPVRLVDLNGKAPKYLGNKDDETAIGLPDPNTKYYDGNLNAKKGTFSIGVTADVTLFVGVQIGACLSIDRHGNVALQMSGANPGDWRGSSYFGGIDAGVSKTVQFTNAETVYDLERLGESIGGSGGFAGYFGVDAINLNGDNKIDGYAISTGVGVGADTHIVKSYTSTMFSINIIEKWNSIKSIVGIEKCDIE